MQKKNQFSVPDGCAFWKKDINLNYVDCNQKYAEVAGFTSPSELIGKNDYQMPWAEIATGFRDDDEYLIKCSGDLAPYERIMSMETEVTSDGNEIEIIVFEQPWLDEDGRTCLGVQGWFIQANGQTLVQQAQFESSIRHRATFQGEKVILPKPFEGVTLSKRELLAAYWLHILGTFPAAALHLNRDVRTIEGAIERINAKLHAVNFAWNKYGKTPLLSELNAMGVFDLMRSPRSPLLDETKISSLVNGGRYE